MTLRNKNGTKMIEKSINATDVILSRAPIPSLLLEETTTKF